MALTLHFDAMTAERVGCWARPGRLAVWATIYLGLAAEVVLSQWPQLLQWVFEPSSRIIAFRYYSPLIELTLIVYLTCAFAFWRGLWWAPWLASAWVIVSAVSRSFLFVLPVGGMDTSQPGLLMSTVDLFRQGPQSWPMAMVSALSRVTLIALLFGQPPHSHVFRVVDQIVIRFIGVAQLLAFIYVLFFPYGIGFYPPVLPFNLAGAVGAVLLLLGKRQGRIVLLIWYALLLVFVFIGGNGPGQRYPTEVAIAICGALLGLAYLALSLRALR